MHEGEWTVCASPIMVPTHGGRMVPTYFSLYMVGITAHAHITTSVDTTSDDIAIYATAIFCVWSNSPNVFLYNYKLGYIRPIIVVIISDTRFMVARTRFGPWNKSLHCASYCAVRQLPCATISWRIARLDLFPTK